MNFLDLVKTRYSVRSYDSRPIEKEKMDYVMECARMAPRLSIFSRGSSSS